jgi:hypothetical protein
MDTTSDIRPRRRGPKLDLASAACRKPGRWRDAYQRRINLDRKPPLVALTATGNSVGRTCFALMLTGADYDPGHEATGGATVRPAFGRSWPRGGRVVKPAEPREATGLRGAGQTPT